MGNCAVKITFLLSLAFFLIRSFAPGDASGGITRDYAPAFISQEKERSDIEWFKNELGVSSKYTEHESGVMGLSWAHFLTMVFLILSFVAAMIALILRYRRTKKLLSFILKEVSQNDREG